MAVMNPDSFTIFLHHAKIRNSSTNFHFSVYNVDYKPTNMYSTAPIRNILHRTNDKSYKNLFALYKIDI